MKKIILILCVFTLHFANAKDTTILFLGDSLTEGLGVQKEEAFPALVQGLIHTRLGKKVTIINGGVSGSTTSDALARLKWYMRHKPDIIFIALGANDGLRGLDLHQSQANLEAIITHAKSTQATVLLAGMLIPPNYGENYTQKFKTMFETLGQRHALKMMPFLLQDVAGEKRYNQQDGIHPNTEGHQRIAHNVFDFIKEEL